MRYCDRFWAIPTYIGQGETRHVPKKRKQSRTMASILNTHNIICMFVPSTVSCLTHSAPTLFTILDKQGRCILNTIQDGIPFWVYMGLDALISFIIPFTVIVTCYFNIWRALRGSKVTKGLAVGRSQEKQKATRIVIVLVLFFAICSLPRPILTVAISMAGTGTNYKLHYRLILALYWSTLLLFINSAVNPVMYTLTGKTFKKHMICFNKQSSHEDVTI